MLRSRIAAGVLAACCGCGVVGAQVIEFRIVEREGQTTVSSAADAQLNMAVQARFVGGALGEGIAYFNFDLIIRDEPDAFGTLARGLTSNPDGTYSNALSISSVVGQGGLARQYSYLAGLNSAFNGQINSSTVTFINTPAQEIGLISGFSAGSVLIGTPGIDVDMDELPDTYPGTGTQAPLDPAVASVYFGADGSWTDIYRFRYTVSDFTTRTLTFDIRLPTAGTSNTLSRSGSSWSLSAPQSPRPCTSVPTTIQVGVSDSGACCELNGVCAVTAGSSCAAAFLVGSSCSPSPCQPTGACCETDGNCRVAFDTGCTGDWTLDASCNPNLCPLPGACCSTAGACAVLQQSSCLTGTWISGGACSPNLCPQPGACCFVDGNCSFTIQSLCTAGVWQSGASCAGAACPARGACCTSSSQCEVTFQSGCVGGAWVSGGVCVPIPCAQLAACCLSGGSCTLSTLASCTSGIWLAGGVCSPNACTQPGACCATDGSCVAGIRADCAAGTWRADDTCSPNPCPQPGACCTGSGSCSVVLQSACSAVWVSGGTCAPNICPEPGACCGITCELITAQMCSSGRTWIAGTCSPNPCPPPLACCNQQSGACSLVIPVANLEYNYSYMRGVTGYSRNDAGGTVDSISASFHPLTKRLVFEVRLSSSTQGGMPDSSGFWLVLNNGPDPKGRPGELAIFYFDASTLASPVLTVYGYNGADAGTSWSDGDPGTPGDQVGDLIKGAFTTGYIHSVVAEDVTISGGMQRRMVFDIDASDILTHVPVYPAATPWFGTGFDRTLGLWLHPSRTFAATYDNTMGPERGRILSLSMSGTGWLDANGRATMNNDPCPSGTVAQPESTCSPTNTCPQQRACCNPNTGACILVAPSSDCLAGYLFASPSTNTCSPSPCLVLARQATGACCSVLTGACWLLPESSCTTGTHQWQAESVCDPNPCPPAQGACCNVVTGTCTVKAQATCGVNAHDWLAGRTCGPGTCDVPGICCNAATGACRRLTEARCESPNAWSPEGVCSPNPCGTIGRCCNVYTGACQMTTRAACGPMAHDWMPGSTCAPNPCDVPGACCNDTVGACGRVTRSRCGPQNAWTAGAFCSPNPCQLVGKCCNVRTGACRLVVKSSCPSARNDWSPSGVCGPEACVQPGVCCNITTGACRMLTEERCGSASVWLPSGTCTPNPCSVPRGACCNVVTGTCAVTTHAACAPAAHDWFAGAVCTPNSCERPAACCNPDSGSCRRLTESRCVAIGGVWLSSQTCGPSVCGVALAQGCPADFDRSGEIDIQDLLTFVNAWFAMDARADVRVSGELDITDIFDYLNAWLAGC